MRRILDWLFPIRVEARCEADELMEAHGNGAYYEARKEHRAAFKNGDERRDIWKRSHYRHVGRDTRSIDNNIKEGESKKFGLTEPHFSVAQHLFYDTGR